jgi:hypothetical protein
MHTLTYYKMGNRWFLDLPEYIEHGGDSDDLERVGAFHDFLEMVAEGETTLVFQLDGHPFEGADVLELTGSTGGGTGGYYHLKTFEGREIDMELWFNIIFHINQQGLLPRYYIKRVPLTN